MPKYFWFFRVKCGNEILATDETRIITERCILCLMSYGTLGTRHFLRISVKICVNQWLIKRKWKTVTGALIVLAGAYLKFKGETELAEAIMGLGGALGLIGIAHKHKKTEARIESMAANITNEIRNNGTNKANDNTKF